MNRREFLSNLVRIPFIAPLLSLQASEPESHQEPVALENALIAAGGDTESGSTLVFGDCCTLQNCVIQADKVIMGKCSTIMYCMISVEELPDGYLVYKE